MRRDVHTPEDALRVSDRAVRSPTSKRVTERKPWTQATPVGRLVFGDKPKKDGAHE